MPAERPPDSRFSPEVREFITRHTAYNKHDTGWAKGAPSEDHTTPLFWGRGKKKDNILPPHSLTHPIYSYVCLGTNAIHSLFFDLARHAEFWETPPPSNHFRGRLSSSRVILRPPVGDRLHYPLDRRLSSSAACLAAGKVATQPMMRWPAIWAISYSTAGHISRTRVTATFVSLRLTVGLTLAHTRLSPSCARYSESRGTFARPE